VSDERKWAERKVGFARLWARAKQVLTTDPTGSDEDDLVVDEEAARALAAQAGRLKGGLAKVAQLAAYDPGASLGRGRGPRWSEPGSAGRAGMSAQARAVLGGLWDHAPAVSAGAIASVVEQDLGRAPQALFAHWDAAPIAAASLGQVHAAKLHDGTEVVVKVQYPGVADKLRADLDDEGFLRKLSGAEIGRTLDDDALQALGEAVRGELDYRAEGTAQMKFAAAWDGDKALRVPRVIGELSSQRVLTMTRAMGKPMIEVAASGAPDVRAQTAAAIYKFAWGSPLAHGLLNADPNPGNYLVEVESDGHVLVHCLDFGCAMTLPDEVREVDRDVWWGLLDEEQVAGAERFRVALAKAGLLRRTESLATLVHREWESALAQPLATHGNFHWDAAYAGTFAETSARVLAAGGLQLPAKLILLWRQRLGAAAVIGMLDAKAPFRRVLFDLIGSGKRALR
jgi:predicted unusual protein kinase regulating ubiquinone biosynthesis (AarF/ABC1/UbiB family)